MAGNNHPYFMKVAKNFNQNKRKISTPDDSGNAQNHQDRKKRFLQTPPGYEQKAVLDQKRQELMREVRQLPIFFGKGALIQEVARNETVIVMSETGSGKTTQLPQYILNQYSSRGIVCCTQPRRVAAISVASRVSKEVGCPLGDVVGYTVRFEDVTSPQTKLKYMTDVIQWSF